MINVSISNFDPREYAVKLSEFIQEINLELRGYNEYLKNSVLDRGGWSASLSFEPVTGGIILKDYEWFLCQSPYKQAFSRKKNKCFEYILPLDNGVLLRGASVYYYIACFKKKNGVLTKNNLLEWKKSIGFFLRDMLEATYSSKSMEAYEFAKNQFESKLILGVLDNLRHLVLHCATATVVHENKKNCIISLDENMQKKIFLLSRIHGFMEKIVFEKEINDVNKSLRELIIEVKNEVENTFSIIMNEEIEENYSRCFKIHREADNFFENYCCMLHSALKRKNFSENFNTNVCAVMSGGLELAILFAYHLQIDISNISFACISRKYLFRQAERTDKISTISVDPKKEYIFVDDNTLTGNTIKICYDMVNVKSNKNIKNVLLRHPDVNRIPQMVACNCAVDIEFLRNNCLGMLCESPYTRIPMDTNYGGEYLDSSGTFTLTGEFFLKYLQKNGLFSKNSEVGSFANSLRCIVEEYDNEILL